MISNSAPPRRPRITVLTPVYNEEQTLQRYAAEVTRVLLNHPDYDFTVLFIDDGSRERSWEIIKELCRADSRFKGIRLSRNFGSHTALSAGFDRAEGDAVCTLACDLQDPALVILEFLEKWRQGAKIVWGKRRARKDSLWRVLCGNLFFFAIKRFAMPKGSQFTTGSFLLADKAVVECVRQFKEHNRTIFALVAWTGFDQAVVEYERVERMAGKSGWTFGKMLKSMYDTFIGFSMTPVKLVTRLGISVSFLNMIFICYLLYAWFTGNPLAGWTSVMATVTLFFGLQFLIMGMVGEYLSRIYIESMRRPLYFVSETTESHD